MYRTWIRITHSKYSRSLNLVRIDHTEKSGWMSLKEILAGLGRFDHRGFVRTQLGLYIDNYFTLSKAVNRARGTYFKSYQSNELC